MEKQVKIQELPKVLHMSKITTHSQITTPLIDESHHTEMHFRSIFDTAVIGIGIIDLNGKVVDANPALCHMLGLPRQEIIGQSPAISAFPGDSPESTPEFKELFSGQRDNLWAERRFVSKNGKVFWAHVTMSVVRGSDGKALYLIGMVVDINDQKQATAELGESEKRFRAVFDNSAIGISLIGLDRKPIAINKALVKMTGYDLNELMQLTGLELSYPEDADIGREEFWEVINGVRDSYQIEKRYVRKDQSVYWARLSVSGVHGPDGKIQYLVSMTEDITSQKLAQEHLQASEARFRAMFDNTSVGIALTDLNRKIIQVNEAAAHITGYTQDELQNINPIDLSLPEDRLIGQDALQEMIAGQRDGMTVERRYVRKNGKIFWGRVTYSLVRDLTGTPQYLIGLVEDINDQKLAAVKLAEQEAEYRRTLELRVEERTRELRDANLRLVNEIGQREKAEEALAAKAVEEAISIERTRLARDLHDAVTQTLFSASLIAEVLPDLWDMDQVEARKSTLELAQLTRGALAEMRTLLLELRPAALTQARFPDLLKQLSEAVIGRARLPVNLVVEGEYELPPDIKVAFYRIAQESLNNIVKYSRATQVEIRLSLDCCDVHLEIADNGAGFDKSKVKPTSLGMRIMRERADAIHAHLQVSSNPGSGTTVSVDWNEDEVIPISKIPTLR